jgi:hypothetical protein
VRGVTQQFQASQEVLVLDKATGKKQKSLQVSLQGINSHFDAFALGGLMFSAVGTKLLRTDLTAQNPPGIHPIIDQTQTPISAGMRLLRMGPHACVTEFAKPGIACYDVAVPCL